MPVAQQLAILAASDGDGASRRGSRFGSCSKLGLKNTLMPCHAQREDMVGSLQAMTPLYELLRCAESYVSQYRKTKINVLVNPRALAQRPNRELLQEQQNSLWSQLFTKLQYL